jgi:hypothetical protein
MEVFLRGLSQPALSAAGREGALIAPLEWPSSGERAATLAFINAVMRNPLAAPEPIALQVDCAVRALAECNLQPAVTADLTV